MKFTLHLKYVSFIKIQLYWQNHKIIQKDNYIQTIINKHNKK
jgi:hypothetical protein